MRKNLVSTLTIVAFSFAVLFNATSAYALSVDVSPAVSVADSLGGIGNNVDQYQITLNSDTAAKVTAFNLSVTGTLAQAQNFTFAVGVPSPLLADVQPFGAGAIAQDSHFIVDLILPGSPIPPPTEGVIPGLAAPNSGFGQDLVSNSVAIAGLSQASSVLALQVVLDPGTMAILTGTIAIEGNPTPVDIGQIFIGGIPEPSTMILAGLGMIGVFTSRRRKS